MLAAPCTYGYHRPARAAPLQGRTLNRWFAAVVGCRNVEPRNLSMIGIDTLAHMPPVVRRCTDGSPLPTTPCNAVVYKRM